MVPVLSKVGAVVPVLEEGLFMDYFLAVVFAALWFSVRLRKWWCEERDLCTTDLQCMVLAVLWYSGS